MKTMLVMLAVLLSASVGAKTLECQIVREMPTPIGNEEDTPERLNVVQHAMISFSESAIKLTAPISDEDKLTTEPVVRQFPTLDANGQAYVDDQSFGLEKNGKALSDLVFSLYLGGASPHYSTWYFSDCKALN